jgi:hypothetical protein
MGLFVFKMAKLQDRKPAAQEMSVLHDRFHRRQEFMSGTGLYDVAPRACPDAQGVLSYRRALVLTNEKDSAGRSAGADSPRNFDAIELRQADIQQNQAGLQLFTLADRFQSIRRFADNLEFRTVLEHSVNETPPGLEVIDNKNANCSQLFERPPASSKFTTTPVTGGAELTVTGLLQRIGWQSLLESKPVFAVEQRGIREARLQNALRVRAGEAVPDAGAGPCRDS